MPENARQDVTLDICRTSWGQGVVLRAAATELLEW